MSEVTSIDPGPNPEAAKRLQVLDINVFDEAARTAAEQLHADGVAVARFSPGDATDYAMIVVDQDRHGVVKSGARFVLASTYGPAYPLPDPLGRIDVGYAMSAYIAPGYRNVATGVVYAEFIHRLGQHYERAAA